VCDFDDTLAHTDHTVSKRAVEAINAYIEAGGVFTIATGRMFASVRQEVKNYKINLDAVPIISYQGAMIAMPDGRVLRHIKIEKNLSLELLKELEDNGLYCQIFSEDKLYCRKKIDAVRRYEEVGKVKAIETGIPLSEFFEKSEHEITLITIVDYPENIAKVSKEYIEKYKNILSVNMSKPYYLEIAPLDANKGKAIEFLQRHFKISNEKTAAIGDSPNDEAMIRYAGHGVAVANADSHIKAIADEVIGSNDDDGVAQFIEQVLKSI
jgi:Cof subfamily protein (haloacid dehalogenase superfamily)